LTSLRPLSPPLPCFHFLGEKLKNVDRNLFFRPALGRCPTLNFFIRETSSPNPFCPLNVSAMQAQLAPTRRANKRNLYSSSFSCLAFAPTPFYSWYTSNLLTAILVGLKVLQRNSPLPSPLLLVLTNYLFVWSPPSLRPALSLAFSLPVPLGSFRSIPLPSSVCVKEPGPVPTSSRLHPIRPPLPSLRLKSRFVKRGPLT